MELYGPYSRTRLVSFLSASRDFASPSLRSNCCWIIMTHYARQVNADRDYRPTVVQLSSSRFPTIHYGPVMAGLYFGVAWSSEKEYSLDIVHPRLLLTLCNFTSLNLSILRSRRGRRVGSIARFLPLIANCFWRFLRNYTTSCNALARRQSKYLGRQIVVRRIMKGVKQTETNWALGDPRSPPCARNFRSQLFSAHSFDGKNVDA